MHRFYIHPSLATQFEIGAKVDLPGHIAHQILNVLHLRTAEQIIVFTGDGFEWTAELTTSLSRGDVSAQLLSVSKPDREMATEVSMLMALTRSQRYELALAKCTELGTHEFHPIISERVLKSDATIGNNLMRKWNRIVCESAELSGRVRLPNIAEPAPLLTAVSRCIDNSGSVIVLWEDATEPMFVDALTSLRNNPEPPSKIAFVLGPVDGFSKDEVQTAIEQGAMLASLGPRVLRTETAAIAVMSLAAQLLP